MAAQTAIAYLHMHMLIKTLLGPIRCMDLAQYDASSNHLVQGMHYVAVMK